MSLSLTIRLAVSRLFCRYTGFGLDTEHGLYMTQTGVVILAVLAVPLGVLDISARLIRGVTLLLDVGIDGVFSHDVSSLLNRPQPDAASAWGMISARAWTTCSVQ